MALAMKRVDRRARRGRAHPMSDINVTPFVDVMLVLLIVFMVSALECSTRTTRKSRSFATRPRRS